MPSFKLDGICHQHSNAAVMELHPSWFLFGQSYLGRLERVFILAGKMLLLMRLLKITGFLFVFCCQHAYNRAMSSLKLMHKKPGHIRAAGKDRALPFLHVT